MSHLVSIYEKLLKSKINNIEIIIIIVTVIILFKEADAIVD